MLDAGNLLPRERQTRREAGTQSLKALHEPREVAGLPNGGGAKGGAKPY